MQSRRNFIGKVATGLAGAVATKAANAVPGANDRIRIGIIGPGDRGSEILRQAVSLPGVECVGAADVYTYRLEQVKQIAPDAKTYLDYRHLLDDKSIDAVLIATPQHLHAECFTAALDAGKHVYQEKTMAFNPRSRQAHARGIPEGVDKSGRAHRHRGTSMDLAWPVYRRHEFSQARTDGQDHHDSGAHVPQHAAR